MSKLSVSAARIGLACAERRLGGDLPQYMDVLTDCYTRLGDIVHGNVPATHAANMLKAVQAIADAIAGKQPDATEQRGGMIIQVVDPYAKPPPA